MKIANQAIKSFITVLLSAILASSAYAEVRIVNAESGEIVADLKDGSTININSLPGSVAFESLQSKSNASKLRSIFFNLSGPVKFSFSDRALPYCSNGNTKLSCNRGKRLKIGNYSLKLTKTFKRGSKVTEKFNFSIYQDNSETPRIIEEAPGIQSGNQNHLDLDGDGVINSADNCPQTSNRQQIDSDGDGKGDECDICPGFDDRDDQDTDTIPDSCDNCIDYPNNDQLDFDMDGKGDACGCLPINGQVAISCSPTATGMDCNNPFPIQSLPLAMTFSCPGGVRPEEYERITCNNGMLNCYNPFGRFIPDYCEFSFTPDQNYCSSKPPSFAYTNPRSVSEGSTISFNVTAFSSNSDGVSYSVSNLPQGAIFDPSTQSFSWTPECGQQAGSYQPVFTASNSNGTSTLAVDIEVTPFSGYTGHYEEKQLFSCWATQNISDSLKRGENDDPDNDGVINLFEYAFGSNPASGLQSNMPKMIIRNGAPFYVYYKNSLAVDLYYVLQFSNNLATFTSYPDYQADQAVDSNGRGYDIHEVPLSGAPGKFVRLDISIQN